MDADRDGRVPLPESGDSDSAERAGVHRDGIRRARRVSNWTAAALIAGTGAAAVALAHQAVPVAAPASGTAAPAAGSAARAGAPQVTHSVATTSASGVTTTTTTQTVNGKTIVARVRNVPAHGDDR
jgi:hypothetical protein